jgi:dTDP-4-dehydrorhamnose reductase
VLAQAQQAQSAIKLKQTRWLPSPPPTTPPRAAAAHSRLDTRKLQAAFGLTLPPWQDGVQRMLQEILQT